MKKNNELFVLVSILLQGLFIIILNNLILTSKDLHMLKKVLPGITIVIVLLMILNIYSISRLQRTVEYRFKVQILKQHFKQIESLLQNLQVQRHEYRHHLQVIESMVYLGQNNELKDYLNGITKSFKHGNDLLYTGHLAVNGLLNTKCEIAESEGIKFAVAVKCDLSKIDIPVWSLCEIIANLIDNAIEAAVIDKEPRVGIEFKNEEGNYSIYVTNNGAQIREEEKVNIFKAGYSTKGYPTRGYGLYLVKKTVDYYGGNIFIKSGKQTTLIVQLPNGEVHND